MLSDRPYLREGYARERTSVVTWLVCALVAGFVLQFILGSRWIHSEDALYQTVGLTIPGLESGRWWTLLTHSFLHSPSFIFHAIGNVLLLYFLGRELIPLITPGRLFGIYAAATAIGGLAWAAVHWRFGGGDVLIGATAAVYAFVAIYACFFPYQEIRFWLFFVIPVTLKPKYVVYSLAGFDLIGLAGFEMPGVQLPFGIEIAHSAHLGGLLAGFLYFRFLHEAAWLHRRPRRPALEAARSARIPRKAAVVAAPAVAPAVPARPDIRVEVDRILDKINSHGFASLTPEERRILDDAKDAISRG